MPLAYTMGELDAGQCSGRAPERLEASHSGAAAFDRSMILLDQIVEVLTTSHVNVLPPRILPPQIPKGQVALHVAVERDLARPPRQTCRKGFAKECLCGGDAAIRTKQKIDRLADRRQLELPAASITEPGGGVYERLAEREAWTASLSRPRPSQSQIGDLVGGTHL